MAWLYWYFWVIVVGFEAVAGTGLLQKWLPVILPWDSLAPKESPFVVAFERMGIAWAADLMNAVVLSCLNSGLYTASRMLFVLAGRREAPPFSPSPA
ncbi:hypothetical protein [Inquilinus sp.]|jgi:L-asparagine transporter-like permease|uniref:hypothetical protein n=1 Tax=Inquilinus sp. TaxID=1932117 RepID=UPI00378365CD